MAFDLVEDRRLVISDSVAEFTIQGVANNGECGGKRLILPNECNDGQRYLPATLQAGSHEMSEDDSIRRLPIKDLRQEDGAHELATSPEMEPYLRLIMAQMQGGDTTAEMEALRQLPLEKRYVWRVASALKWAFADLETESVTVDKETLTPADFGKVMDLLKLRPVQFCLFLKALVGVEDMQRVMVQAIGMAKQVG